MQPRDFFKGKKVTQLGLGLLGRGLRDALFLAECGADLTVTDMKTEEELASSVAMLRSYAHVRFVLGEHRLEDFRDRDFILKGAGVPLDSPYIAEARKNGIPVEMDASLFLKLAPSVITIGVTGTRGKTTTTVLIHEIARAHFTRGGQRVFLAGNIKDTAALPLLDEVKEKDIVVMELDSWQLQGFGDVKISPHIAVFTNFMDDHLNYYRGDRELYFMDKANIFLHQKQNDYLVTGERVAHLITAKCHGKLFHQPTTASAQGVPRDWNLKVPGNHFRESVALAVGVAKILGIPYETIKDAVERFTGVPGRLEFLSEHTGVKIYNDTTATTPDATVAALRALHEGGPLGRNIVLIMGGADKSLSMEKLFEEIPRSVKSIVLLPGTGTDRIRGEVHKLSVLVDEVASLEEAVRVAFDRARKGDILLFSPAFASFGLFKNEYDRGDRFVDVIRAQARKN